MPTLDQLNALADQVPQLTAKAAAAQQAQQAAQTQQQIGQTKVAPGNVTQTAQAAAPGLVQADTKIATGAQAATQAALGQVANTGLAVQSTQDKAAQAAQDQAAQEAATTAANAEKAKQVNDDLGMRKRVTAAEQESAKRLSSLGIEQDNNLQLMTIRQRQQLAQLGGDVKQQILDSRLQFDRDEMGRKFSNERQLADYAIANAKTQQDFDAHMQTMQETAYRKTQLLQSAFQKINSMVQNSFTSQEQELDNQKKQQLIQLSIALKERIRKEKAKAANTMAQWQAGGTIVGAVVGAVVTGGNPAGAMAGGAIGGSLGTVIGSEAGGAKGSGDGT